MSGGQCLTTVEATENSSTMPMQVSLRVGFKGLGSLFVLVIGAYCYLLGNPLASLLCLVLSLYISKDRWLQLFGINSNNSNSGRSKTTTALPSTPSTTTNPKKNTPNLATKRQQIGLDLLNSRLAATGNTELLV